MDPITVALICAVPVVVAAVAAYETIKRKNEELQATIAALETYSQTYAFEECDQKIIADVQSYLKSKFGNDYVAVFNSYQSMDEKKAFFEKVAKDIAGIMQVDLDDVKASPIDDYTFGFTTTDGKHIIINEVLLNEDPKQAVKTLCHELRHCMQVQSISDNKWGFSPERIAEWIFSFQHYNDSIIFYDAYVNTIVEVDANKYADKVVDY